MTVKDAIEEALAGVTEALTTLDEVVGVLRHAKAKRLELLALTARAHSENLQDELKVALGFRPREGDDEPDDDPGAGGAT